MKIQLLNLICAFLTTSSLTVYAQIKNHPVEVKAKKSIYIYERSTVGPLMSVYRKNSIPEAYSSTGTKFVEIYDFEYTTEKPISKSLREVFSPARLKKLSAEFLILNMYLSPAGRITALKYYINENTKIKSFELEKLETAIKKNTAWKLINEDKNGILPPVTQTVSITKVLNGTFPD